MLRGFADSRLRAAGQLPPMTFLSTRTHHRLLSWQLPGPPGFCKCPWLSSGDCEHM